MIDFKLTFNTNSKYCQYLIAFALFVLSTLNVLTQTAFYPSSNQIGEFNYYYGIEIAGLPSEIGEDMVKQLPYLAFDARYGVAKNVSLNARFRSILITNIIDVGVEYSLNYNNFGLGIGNKFVYWHGFAEFGGMDASAGGFMLNPYFVIGSRFRDISASMKFEPFINLLLSRRVGESEISNTKYKIMGWKGTLLLEQPFYRNSYILLGFGLNYSVFHNQSWLAFSSAKNWLLIPEFQLGFRI